MLLHRARAIDEKAHGRVGLRLDPLAPEQPPLERRGDESGEAATVDAAFFLGAVPALLGRHGEQRVQRAGQARGADTLRRDALLEPDADARPALRAEPAWRHPPRDRRRS